MYAGSDPITGGRYELTEIVPAGPAAAREAQKVLNKLVHQVDQRRHPKTNATVIEPRCGMSATTGAVGIGAGRSPRGRF